MAKAKQVKITVLGAGLSYKGEVDVSVAGQIISWCLSESHSDPHPASTEVGLEPAASRPRASSSRESASEYFNRYAPKRNPDKILALACYLRDVRNQDSFTAKDIKVLFRDVGELFPGNFKRDFKWAATNGWIGKELGTKDSYYVTTTGTNALQAGFSKEVLDKTKIKARGHSRVKKTKKN